MKLREIFRFELARQLRRPWAWFAMLVLIAFAIGVTRVGMLPVTLPRDFILNSPFIITTATVREPNPWPPMRMGLPLLRAMDPWANRRKGPYAMNALAEYVGEERINAALRTLTEKKASSLATTLDLYRELQAVTPDSLKPLLHDLFEVNTFWRFDTHQARAVQTDSGAWRVPFEVEARKVVADSAGAQTEVPITEWVEIGVFAPAGPGEILGRTLYLQKHRIRSGTQTITVTVADRPARAGIDPYSLLDWDEGDNIEPIEIEMAGHIGPRREQPEREVMP